MLKRLWNDEVGAILSAEVVLIATILVIGVVVGLASLRDAVVSELADVGGAIAAVDQSYSVGGTSGHHSATNGFHFKDNIDSCDDGPCGQSGVNSRCVELCTGNSGECTFGSTAGG